MQKIEFNLATTGDFQAIAKLASSVDELSFISPNSQYPWTPQQVADIAKQRKQNTVLKTSEGLIIGYANLYNIKPNNYAFIGNVIVQSEYQGQGLGQQLMNHMIQTCLNTYDAQPRLSVFNTNTAALLFYNKLGFVPYAMEQRILKNEKVMLIHFKYFHN